MLFEDIKFLSEEHKKDYVANYVEGRVTPYDKERQAFFYLLSMLSETRNHIDDLYDFNSRSIKIEGLNKGWQTGTSTRITKLAFNLFNGYDEGNCSPLDLFCVDDEIREHLLEAIRIRFN